MALGDQLARQQNAKPQQRDDPYGTTDAFRGPAVHSVIGRFFGVGDPPEAFGRLNSQVVADHPLYGRPGCYPLLKARSAYAKFHDFLPAGRLLHPRSHYTSAGNAGVKEWTP